MFSQEYIAALAIVVVGVLKLFKIDVGTEEISAAIVGLAGIWVMIRRFNKGDITVLGARKTVK